MTLESVALLQGDSAGFVAQGLQDNGSPIAVPVVWSATGGAVSTGGQYQAGATAGSYRVVASTTNLTLADTYFITITGTASPPPGATVLLTESFDDAAVAGRGC